MALILFGMVALPIVLFVMFTVVPPEAAMPLKIGVTVVDEFNTIPAIILLDMLMTLLVPPPVLIQIGPPVLAVAVKVIPGVAVVDPIILPNIVPTLAFPFAIFIKPRILI